AGVDNTFFVIRLPFEPANTVSVKVPPMSVPTLKYSCMLFAPDPLHPFTLPVGSAAAFQRFTTILLTKRASSTRRRHSELKRGFRSGDRPPWQDHFGARASAQSSVRKGAAGNPARLYK